METTVGLSIVIGVVSGVISGIIVNVFSSVYHFDKDFENDKQVYMRWLDRIRASLEKSYDKNDYSDVLLLIADEPIRETFVFLKAECKESAEKISESVETLKWKIIKSQTGITEDTIKRHKAELYKLKSEVISYDHYGVVKRLLISSKLMNDICG